MSTRAAPMYCPYCGEEDLRPNEASHGAWECRACARVFTVKFAGLLPAGGEPGRPDQAGSPSTGQARP